MILQFWGQKRCGRTDTAACLVTEAIVVCHDDAREMTNDDDSDYSCSYFQRMHDLLIIPELDIIKHSSLHQ